MKKLQKREGYHAGHRMGVLMQQILEARAKFADPEKQSIYFKWGKQNNKAVLNGHEAEYEKKRKLFNGTSQAAFEYELQQIEAEMQWLREARRHRSGSNTPFIIVMGSLCSKRDRMEIYVKLKDITERLPEVEELGAHEELVGEIRGARL